MIVKHEKSDKMQSVGERNLREASLLLLDQSPSIFRFHTVVFGKFQFHVMFYSIFILFYLFGLIFGLLDKKVVEQAQATKGKDISNPQCFYSLSLSIFLLFAFCFSVFRFQNLGIYNLGLLSFNQFGF